MALFGFQGLGWFVAGVSVALGGYMVTSQGAAERARLHMLEARIVAAKKEIRGLETEFNTRANLAQLERWNGTDLKMAAPDPRQFLASETALADIDRVQPEAPELATLVVPAGAPRAEPEPAVAEGPAATAQAAPATRVASRTVAMADTRMLAPSTVSDLQRAAATERLALR